MSRQNYYAVRRQRQRRLLDSEVVLHMVREERRIQPRLGARKLLHLLRKPLLEAKVELGRDRFLAVLRHNGLLVERKPRTPRTTQSRHSLPVFRNLVRENPPQGPNEVWVSDLTYVRTEEGCLYAAVIMDAWSRKLVGLHVGDSLESVGCQEALSEALKELPPGKHPIHHSDRGCQYCCHAYVGMLREAGMPVSMTQENHCYENAQAERVIGILKGEYELDRWFNTKAQARAAIRQARQLYNERRPHFALNLQVPAEVHRTGRRWLRRASVPLGSLHLHPPQPPPTPTSIPPEK
jgi:transposase InsO family protein